MQNPIASRDDNKMLSVFPNQHQLGIHHSNNLGRAGNLDIGYNMEQPAMAGVQGGSDRMLSSNWNRQMIAELPEVRVPRVWDVSTNPPAKPTRSVFMRLQTRLLETRGEISKVEGHIMRLLQEHHDLKVVEEHQQTYYERFRDALVKFEDQRLELQENMMERKRNTQNRNGAINNYNNSMATANASFLNQQPQQQEYKQQPQQFQDFGSQQLQLQRQFQQMQIQPPQQLRIKQEQKQQLSAMMMD